MAPDEKESPPPPALTEHRVEHFQQRYSWDCGLSCVLMLLSAKQRQEMLENFHQLCQEEGFGQSTWTIDLCYLLKRYSIAHTMYTIRRGVNHHRKHGYYSKIMDLDAERVHKRFAQANHEGIKVIEYPITDKEILNHVVNVGPAIVLVDSGLLTCELCKHNKLKAEFRRVFGGVYRGHYILVVGRRAGRWLYRDPARPGPLCAARPVSLREARVAPGTDRDVILVYNDYR
ncbi:protein GUCD1 [Epargyreus clarus]|uniref:protein GUCD1 n=1 Tax=Epargyreus clarus TaxID=520877 RepID=UPI003C2D306C